MSTKEILKINSFFLYFNFQSVYVLSNFIKLYLIQRSKYMHITNAYTNN